MSREQDLLAAFIEFADTFVADYDVVEFLHRLAERCVELIDASEAGIMLADRDGTLHYIASSSERMRLIELFELQHDEGPCLDAYRTGRRSAQRHDRRRERAVAALRAPRPRRRLPVGVRAADATPRRGDRRPQPLLDLLPYRSASKTSKSPRRSPTSRRSASSKNERCSDGHIVTSPAPGRARIAYRDRTSQRHRRRTQPRQRRRRLQTAARLRPQPQPPSSARPPTTSSTGPSPPTRSQNRRAASPREVRHAPAVPVAKGTVAIDRQRSDRGPRVCVRW